MLVPPILFVFPLIVHPLTHLSNLSLSPLYSGFYLFSKCFEESGTITWQTYILWCLRSQTPWNASERLSVMSNLRQKNGVYCSVTQRIPFSNGYKPTFLLLKMTLYEVCHSGWKVLNRMRCWFGSRFWLDCIALVLLTCACAAPSHELAGAEATSYVAHYIPSAGSSAQGISRVCKNHLLIVLGYSVQISSNLTHA